MGAFSFFRKNFILSDCDEASNDYMPTLFKKCLLNYVFQNFKYQLIKTVMITWNGGHLENMTFILNFTWITGFSK
jgi:hypothetical protein